MPKGAKLSPRHLRFVDNLMAGMTQIEAYVEAGYKRDEGNAARLTGNDKIKQEIERRRAEIEEQSLHIEWQNKQKLKEDQSSMLDNLKILALEAESESVRLAATKDWLDRSGLKPEEKHTITGNVPITIMSSIPRPKDDESDN